MKFSEIDPLGGGLAEEIAAEQASPDAIVLEDYIEGDSLQQKWAQVIHDLQEDPDWVAFSQPQDDH